MSDQSISESLRLYNMLYDATDANNTFRIVRGMVSHLAAKRDDLTPEQQDRLTSKIMNAVTDAALEIVDHEPCKGAMIRLVHTLAAWNMLHPHLHTYIDNHLIKFANLADLSSAPLFAAYKTTWKVLDGLAPIRKHLQQLHSAFVEEGSVRAAASLRFIEAAQEMLKAVNEMMHPNLSRVESESATNNARIALKRIADGLYYLDLD